MTEAHTTLQTALEQGEPLTLSLATLRPRTLLEWLAASDGAARMSIEDDDGRIVVEVSNGLVVGATAETADGLLQGRPAYERLRKVRTGLAHIEPLRFPSLANILVPVTELPEFHSVRPPAPNTAPDTVVIPLPAARPVHVPEATTPDPTMELELPPELVLAPVVPAPALDTPETTHGWDAAEPTVEAAMEVLEELEAEVAKTDEVVVPVSAVPVPEVASEPPSSRTRALGIWAAAAALALSLGVGGVALSLTEDGPETIAAPAETESSDDADMSFDLADIPDGDTSGDSDTRNEARTLARLARRQLRAGEAAEALTNARRAASLRRHLPYYQVLLGDTLRANGQRRAARRAYRRALRMRPDYAPAQRRLGRSATLASRLETSDHG
ncbi:MAG: hypothetical protein AB8I08_25940 [Sandaracinaceae bacterium]